MSIAPGTYNILVQRGADYSVILQFKDSDLVPIDLTEGQVVAQCWDLSGSTKYADFAVEYLDRLQGRVRLKLTSQQTENFPRQLEYDVLVVSYDGTKNYFLEGTVTTDGGFSKV